ncbi:beta-propeller domain-containing protein [Nocardioides sp. SYSU DS0651]|uniref:beta-propeller domain-containing protein n=1 Tax=Nocardioides sp. SYSU DS0651 TaxID=3415955 RepID=UPI003F4B541A
MTDLERLWEDYPAGEPPVRAILAAGAARPTGRRIVVRPLLTAAAVTVVAGALAAGALLAGGGEVTPPGAERLPRHAAFQADLAAAESCDELLDSYVARALDVVGPWGWEPAIYAHEVGDVNAARDGGLKTAGRAPRTERQVNSDTGTNVQEAAVDEPDTVKTDGDLLLTVRDDELTAYDVTGSVTEELSTLDLPGLEDAEILLSGDTVVAVGADDRAADAPGARVVTVSIADPARPTIVDEVRYDAALLSARQHGSVVRLVLSSGLPDLAFVEPNGRRSAKRALRHNRRMVARSTMDDWLPTIAVTSGSGDRVQRLLDCTDVAIPPDELALDTTSVVGFDARSAGEVEAIGLAGAAPIAYESDDHLYLIAAPEDDGSSYLFDFALAGAAATHVASGEVEGAVRDRWSVDEADGVLRVAVGPTSETGNHNAIVTFRREGDDLVEHGRLARLGRNEDIESVRWFDDLVILVTFRRVDPLYAVDLTDTARPTLLGELKIPGFSSYLHPLGSWRMIGVGEGPDGKGGWGAQVGLFDVRDLRNVRRLDVHGYGPRFEARAGFDPRAFTWLPDRRTVLTVVERWAGRRVGYVSVLKLRHGRLHERLVRVEYGRDVDEVRAVPLPDGRVVLVTGEKAQFFEL